VLACCRPRGGLETPGTQRHTSLFAVSAPRSLYAHGVRPRCRPDHPGRPSGFLPPRHEALASVINVLGISRSSESSDTLDGLLLEMLTTFNSLIGEVISAPEHPLLVGQPILVPFSAAKHVFAVADLLAFLGHNASDCGQADETIKARNETRERWVDTIIRLSTGEGPRPWHLSPTGYVTVTAMELVGSIKVFGENPRVTLDPDNPIIIAEPPLRSKDKNPQARAADPDLAAWGLIWRAASAVCLAACLSPEFRFGPQPSRS
jgi:hypothetical protein